MSDLTHFLVPALFLFFALSAFPKVRVWLRLRQLRFRPGKMAIVSKEQTLARLKPIFQEAERAMEDLGFEYCCSVIIEILWNSEPARHAQIYSHTRFNAFAVIIPPTISNGQVPFEVHYETIFEDGTLYSTVDGISQSIPAFPDWYKIHDYNLGNYVKQWEAHQEVCDNRDEPMLSPTLENFMEYENRYYRETIPSMEVRGDLVHADEPLQWRLTSTKAWQLSSQIIAGERKMVAASQKASSPEMQFSEQSLIAAETAAFDRITASEDFFSNYSKGKGVRFVLSAIAFVLAFTWIWSFDMAMILLVVILIHELGHFLAMALFGYKNRQMFFVPFFGAATMGKKDDATIWQRILVLLGGPVPGLILGIICLYYARQSQNHFWVMPGAMFLVINYLNLLPITPFDGGKILDTLFFDRLPRAQFFFIAGSIFIMLAGGFLLAEPILFLLAMVFIIGLKSKWQQSSAAKQAIAALPPRAMNSIIKSTVIKTLRHGPIAKKPFSARLRVANSLISLLQAAKPSQGEIVGGALIYAGTLIAPLIVLIILLMLGQVPM